MFGYSSFELSILPAFLQYCVESKLNETAFLVLSKLLMTKSPMCGSGIDIGEWRKYPLNFFSSQNNIMIEKILLKHIDEINESFNTSNYVLALICLAHINCSAELGKVLLKNIKILCNIINSGINIKSNLFLLLTSFECMVHTTKHNLVVVKDDLISSLLPLCTNMKYISALKLLDMFITVAKEDFVNMGNLLLIHGSLKTNFSSPYNEVRLYTTHLYSIFDEVQQLQMNNEPEQWNLFYLCYKIQSIEPDVQNYREQLLYLDKFNFDRPQIAMCKRTEFRMVPLRFLCGALYMNFKPLWEPIIKIIASHADGLDINDFWEVYLQELKNVVANIRNVEGTNVTTCEYDNEFVNTLYESTYKINVQPNFVNYRLLIWKAIALFPQIAEANTRDVSVLLLDFVEKEHIRYSGNNLLTYNIKQNNILTEDVAKEDDFDVTLQEDSKLPKRGNNIRNLMQHLEVFTKIRSPKSMYREPELYRLYFDLLCHKKSDVQKIALDCIMTYRFKYLMPYREHLYNLIDDKKLKNELITFKIDKEFGMIQEEHRDDVIPIIMRLVFSKMMSRIGLRTGGKSCGQFRRNIIFRFIAGCQENEMINFTYMSFKYYQEFIKNDPVDMINSMTSKIDLENFIPLKRLQSSLNLIEVIIEQFGTLMGNELLSYLLKILLVIGSFIKIAFSQQNAVHVGFLPLLRNIRTLSIKAINKIFSLFENYIWTKTEINAIFDVFIWPYLKKLHIEGIHSPTALLKLLVTWGSYPRYFCLLNKHYQEDFNYNPLSAIISLLSNEKSHILVTNLIMEMLEKLLYLQPDDMDTQLKISIENELPFSEDIKQELKCKTSFNYGSMIILPHAANVLEKIKYKLENKSRNINQRDLFILSRISELVYDADISDKLLQILLPIVLKKCIQNNSEETILQLMNTLNNLMKNIEMPEKHLKLISPLFSEVVYPSSRKLLIEQLDIIAKNQMPTFSLINEIMTQINAWDSKWIDEPDFQIRCDAFKKIQRLITEGDVTLELGVLLIYNCFYILKSVKDLALRENASHCLKTLAPHLVNGYLKQCDRNYLVDEVLLALIRHGLRSKNDDIRNECISLLGHLSRECADAHVVLKNLHKLTNKLDLEVDFFENLTHLQIHRHGRALQKFTNVYKLEINPPHIRSLTQFILPLTTHYLCNHKYSNKNSVVDAAIEALGIISKLLPWHQYECLLKFYLSKLRQKTDFQKQLVRVVVAILDSFHFDITKGQNWDISKAVKGKNTDTVESNHLTTEKRELEQNSNHEVDEILDSYNLDIEKEDEENEVENVEDCVNNPIKIDEKITILPKSAATRAIYTIQVVLLPQLHRTLAEMTKYESSHKVNKKKISVEKEEEDLQRVPISLALVKLLQRLPKEILDINLPGIFMKLCTFLKSHLDSVRRTARETLQKIMTSLGPPYLNMLLNEIIPLLSKGFQVHVLVYTVHSVLVSLKDMFKPGDVDTVLATIVKLCKADLFGSLSEEKEVGKIINKVFEAKSTKSYDTFYILGQYVTETCLMDIILPIKEILATNQTFKIISKAQDSLRNIALGLVENRFVTVNSLLKFSYGIASESISILFLMKKTALTEKERAELEKRKPDCYIIPKAPAYRSGHKKTIKVSNKTNTCIIMEFGIRLCYLLLKREKVKGTEFKPLLDPFVVIFKDCLASENVKLRVVTLQCLEWIFRYDLPSLRANIEDILQILFQILHQYGAAGLSKGDNFELVVAAFKVITVLVREVKFYVMEPEQLKLLLLYVEQDLYHQDRQAIAFGLLKSILSRRLNSPELYDITMKVSELSITSELPHIRLQSRLVMHQFLMDYPLGKKLDKYISFYLSQLKYETQDCRESAIEMIQTLLNSFPMETLKDYSETFLVTLGARLINDSEPSCRKMIADCINSLFDRLLKQDRDPLFNIIKLWFNEKNVIHQQLAAQLCGILLSVEKTTFETRISTLLPLIKYQLGINQENFSSGKFVRIEKEEKMDLKLSEKAKDHQLFHLLQLLLKMSVHCPTLLKYNDDVEEISKSVQLLLSHPHDWVRLSAAQFLGFVLSSVDIPKLQNLLLNNTSSKGYLYTNPIADITSLSLDLCSQLQSNNIKSELAEQVVKNLVFIARVLENVPINDTSFNLVWLAKRMRKIVNFEIVETPTNITLRTVVFKWIAGVATVIDVKNLLNILHHLLAPIVREMVTEENNISIKHLSKEISNLIKKKIGVEKYTEALSHIEQRLFTKRTERKRLRNQLAVTDPEAFARKKIKFNEKKKQTKKRKISERKGSIKKCKRKKQNELEEEIM